MIRARSLRFVGGALVALALCIGATEALAQTAVVRGFAKDASDGQPLQGINVVLTDEGDGFYGTATDRDGFFAISRIPPGRYLLRATFIGYQPYTDSLTLAPGQILTYNFDISFQETGLDEIIVESEREATGAASVTAGLQTIRPKDITLIPAPDLSGDLVTYLTTLPGVITAGDQGGQFFIRGGEPTQNLVLMDGMVIYQPFHLVGFYSAFPSNIMNVTDVYAGGFGARYGGRISSVIDVSTRNGNKRRFAGELSVAPFISAARLEGPIIPNRVSVLLSGRFSVIDRGISNIIDEPLPYAFDDQFGKIHADLSRNSQASISFLRSYDRGTIGAETEEEAEDVQEQVVWKNQAIGARYILLPTNIPVQAELLLSTSRIENEFGPTDAPARTSMAQQVNAAANITHFVGATDITWGVYVHFVELDSELGGQFQDLQTDREFVSEAGAYIETELAPAPGLRIEPGLRAQTFPSKGRTFIEPRVRVVWNAGMHRLSAAGGIYHQEFVGLSDRRDAGDVFTAWTSSPLGEVPEAIHVLGGYQVRPASWLTLAVEGYYKQLSNLSIAEWTTFPRFTTRLQSADGTVYGLDARLEFSSRRFYGFINYGFSKVEYDAQQTSIQYWFGSPELRFSPPHDRRHQVNALGSLNFYGFTLSTRWQFGSGLPFSESLGFDEFVLLNGPTNVLDEAGDTRVLYGNPYEGRLPSYHRLDVSLERSLSLSQQAEVTVQASITNAYDRINPFYIDLFTLRRLKQLPMVPSVGVKLEF
ncbi:MAG: carboxypeptidase regulatory-like domain-containing protein [Rhodothermales bacterium]